ncbi:DUF4148 domain-containing protein [Paraburkholderia sediminicola]|uniref:DUF4148 domain-containing protein n=1 Tax=Paraburkholderia sp. D1E TaxID=3461398 RepID=UPI000EB00768
MTVRSENTRIGQIGCIAILPSGFQFQAQLIRRIIIKGTHFSSIPFLAALLVVKPSCAQTSQTPLTRAQVKRELVQLEQAGYDPRVNQLDYLASLEAAQRRVASAQATASDAKSSGRFSSTSVSQPSTTQP